MDPKRTVIFTVRTNARNKFLFNFLWKLPRAQMYLSLPQIVLKEREVEIVLSWERDRGLENEYWYLSGSCGYRGCRSAPRVVQFFQLEKRILIQIRELPTAVMPEDVLTKIQSSLTEGIHNYFHRYREIFLIFRTVDRLNLHSTVTVRRTGLILGEHILKLTAEEFDANHARDVFKPTETFSNESDKLELKFYSAFFLDGKYIRRIFFRSCPKVSYQ